MAKGGIETLAQVRLFQDLRKPHLRRILKATEEYSYQDGATVVAEGTASESFFVILKGKARVERRGRTVNRLGPGDSFGEIALLDGGPRTATVVADGRMRCLILLRKEFRQILADEPKVAFRVLRGAAALLRQLDRRVT